MIQINGKNFKGKKIFLDSWEQFHNEFSSPQKLFKYYSNKTNDKGINYSHEHLKTSVIYMADPATFNDPFDCNIAISPTVYEKEFLNKLIFHASNFNLESCSTVEDLFELFYKNHSFFSENSNDLLNNKIRDILTLSFSFLDDEIKNKSLELDEELLEILNKKLYEELSKTFNKNLLFKNNNFYLKNLLIPKDKLLIAFKKAFSITLDNSFQDSLKFLHENIRVSCFTPINNSCLMWSHYADEHKGFCVEYSIEKNIKTLLPVIYNYQRRQLENEILELMDSFIYPNSTWKLIRDGLLTKSFEWKYENEWRLFCVKGKPNDEVTLKIKAIYLGCKMDKDSKNKIMQILTNLKKNIDVYEINLSTTKYSMSSTFLKKI